MRRDGENQQHTGKGRPLMITYAPGTPLETAVLESGRFEFATDTAGREVVRVGHRRLPPVVLPQKADALADLVGSLSADGGRSFTATRGEPWSIEPQEPETGSTTVAAEEYLVMGLRPMKSDGRTVRVAAGREVVRLFLLPWTMPAKTLNFGGDRHFVVTSTRGVVGDWSPVPDGRRGVIIGLSEIWVGVLERQCRPGSGLVFRCDVPVPWVADTGLANAVPTTVGAYEASADGQGSGPVPPAIGETWSATLPIVMTEGNVVNPVLVPTELSVEEIPAGPWERDLEGLADFSIDNLM